MESDVQCRKRVVVFTGVTVLALVHVYVSNAMIHPAYYARALPLAISLVLQPVAWCTVPFVLGDAHMRRQLTNGLFLWLFGGGIAVCAVAAVIVPNAEWKRGISFSAGKSFEEHPRYGYTFRRAPPGKTHRVPMALDNTWGFRMVCDQGRRVTVQRADERASIRAALLGCSFTAGDGASDDETIAAHAARAKPDIFWVNWGISGWGLSQAFVAGADVIETFAREPGKKSIVVHLVIADHVLRSNYDATYLAAEDEGKYIPRLRLIGQHDLVADGLIGPRECGPATHHSQWEGAERVRRSIYQLARRSKEAGVVYLLVLLPKRDVPPYSQVFMINRCAREAGAEFLDLSRIELTADDFVHDGHPKGALYKRIAERIVAHPVFR